MPFIDTTALTLDAIEPADISRYVFEQALLNGALSAFHRIDTGIQAMEKIRLVGLPGLAGECIDDCTPATGTEIKMSEKMWNPKTVGFRLDHCSKSLSQQLIALKKKIARYPDEYNPEGSPEMDVLTAAAELLTKKMVLRFLHFGDTDIENVDIVDDENVGGYLKETINVKYFNCLDGLWKKVFNGVDASKIKKITISENAGTSYDTQELAADTAYNTFRAMFNASDARLKQDRGNAMFLVTRTMADNWLDTLETKSLANTLKADETLNSEGVPKGAELIGSYRKIPIYVMDEWDEIITSYFDDGSKHHLPNRALLSIPDNVPVGTPSDEMFSGSWEPWYEKKDKKVYIDGEAIIDINILEEYKILAAY